MSIRSRARPWSLIVAVAIAAIGLVALAGHAIRTERAESRQTQLQERAGDIQSELRALWVLSDKTGRPVSSGQAKATSSMRADLRGQLDAAAKLSPDQFKGLQRSFASYDRTGHDVVTPANAGSLRVEDGDTDALQAMLAQSRGLRADIDSSQAAARNNQRAALIVLIVALFLAFAVLGGLLLPARKAAADARKRARELKLQREMEERFQPVFERHPQPMWVFDEETLEFLAVNESMISRYGYSRAELLSMKITDLHLTETRDLVEGHIGHQDAARSSSLHVTSAGEQLEVEVHSRSMRFGGHEARMALGIDVTERNRIAKALAESEERHRTVVETAQEGIIVYDLNGVVELMNASMGKITGLDPEEQTGRRITDSDDDLERLELSVEPSIESLVATPAEMHLTRADGDERHLLASSSAWFDAEGEVKGTVVMCSDITEQKLSEARIRESDALKTVMLDSSLDGIYTVDSDGAILEFNRAAETMFQISRKDAIGRNALELLVPVQRRAAAEKKLGPLVNADGRGRVIAERLVGWRADGTEFPAEVTVASTKGGDAHVTVHVRDITERHEHEHTLKARARQQAAVADLGAFSLQAELIDDVYTEAADSIERALGIDHVQVATFDRDRDPDDVAVRVLRGWKTAVFSARGSARHKENSDKLKQGSVIMDIATEDTPARRRLLAEGIKSALIVAVIVNGDLRGSIAIHSRERHAFGSDEQYFIKAVANVVGSALARNEAEERMRDLALHDSLTGLPNRAVFEERLIEWAETADKLAAVAFVDVDHFKVLNDALGHQAGDQLLCALAPRFGEALGEAALVARFGGDEFVALVEDVEDETVAKVLGERLLDALTAPVEIDGRPHHVSVSVGIKLVKPGTDDLQSAVRDADAAMYQAKERGRDRVEVFDKALHQRVVDRLRVDRDLREAMRGDDQLWCAYQPLISAETGEVVGIEALARWRHPELGELSPNEFIPAAEELGLIGSLGWYVLDRAVRDTAAWVAQGGAAADAAFVSVNLSPQQLADPSLAPRISVLLDDVGLSPQRLTLEVTETTLMADTDSAQRGLEELAALGVRLVLDDFGTGFSSMAYLSRMPVSGIKIDRSFVKDLGESASSDAIVNAIVSMAEALELEVVAEGVETQAQAAAAIAIGCGKLQGFLFSKPVPAAEIGKLASSLVSSLAA